MRFHDVAYIEVTPRFDTKNPLVLSVELTDFSVYYSQGLVDAITADLKEGKSEVVCEAGKLVKITKSKSGVVTKEILTKKWTDWVDYWAVDFRLREPEGNHQGGEEPGCRGIASGNRGHR